MVKKLNLIEICNSLAQRGHKVNLVYIKKGNLLTQYSQICDHLVEVSSYTPKRKRIFELLSFSLGLARDVPKIPVTEDSIIFCNDFTSVFFGYMVSLLKGIPLIHYIQIPAYEFKFKWRPGLAAVNKFIAVSNQTKSSWLKLGIPEEKVSVVYNGIDTEKFKPSENFLVERKELGLQSDERVFLFVGRLNRDKGIEVLMKAFALIIEAGVKARLLIAGNPVLDPKEDSPEGRVKYKLSLEQLAADLRIEKQVNFLGHMPNTRTLYRASDVTVVPSIWPDPCPRVVIESLACGTPLVASRIGGIPEILMPTFDNWLFEPGNENELFNTLMQVKDWRYKDVQIGERCRKHILDNFSPEKMIDGIERELLSTLKK